MLLLHLWIPVSSSRLLLQRGRSLRESHAARVVGRRLRGRSEAVRRRLLPRLLIKLLGRLDGLLLLLLRTELIVVVHHSSLWLLLLLDRRISVVGKYSSLLLCGLLPGLTSVGRGLLLLLLLPQSRLVLARITQEAVVARDASHGIGIHRRIVFCPLSKG